MRLLESANLWLRVYSCEVAPSGNHSTLPLKICFEYLNFTLKEYLLKSTGSLFGLEGRHDPSAIPKNLVYILGCVLDAYADVKSLHEVHPCLNILSMLTSITTPSLIYINVDRCLKFLPLPLFIFSDHSSKIE
jgi:hypothetical protein